MVRADGHAPRARRARTPLSLPTPLALVRADCADVTCRALHERVVSHRSSAALRWHRAGRHGRDGRRRRSSAASTRSRRSSRRGTRPCPTMHQAILARLQARDSPAPAPPASLRPLARRPLSAVPSSKGSSGNSALPVIEAYGMTEAAHQIASNPLPPARRRTRARSGLPPGPEIAIARRRRQRRSRPGRVGEVAIRGESVFDGYADNPEANASAFVRGVVPNRRSRRRSTSDGYLQLRGTDQGDHQPRRREDRARRNRRRPPPSTLPWLSRSRSASPTRASVKRSPRRSCSAGGQRDGRTGAAGLRRPDRLHRSRFRAASFFVDEIPKGPTGKVQRIGMHERLGVSELHERRFRARRTCGPRSHLETDARRDLGRRARGRRASALRDDFFALGGDSILGAEAVARIRDLTRPAGVSRCSRSSARRHPRGWSRRSWPDDGADEVVLSASGGWNPGPALRNTRWRPSS